MLLLMRHVFIGQTQMEFKRGEFPAGKNAEVVAGAVCSSRS